MDQIKIGKFIAKIRKEQGLTQSQLAEKLNISNKTVSKWETGNGLPDVSLLTPLCEVLNITSDELFLGEKMSANVAPKKKPKWIAVMLIIIAVILILLLCLLTTCGIKILGKSGFSFGKTPILSFVNTTSPETTLIPETALIPETTLTPETAITPQTTLTPETTLTPTATVSATPTAQIIYITLPPVSGGKITPIPTVSVTATPTATEVATSTSALTPMPTPTEAPTPTATPTKKPTSTNAPIPDSVYGGYKFTSKAGRQSQYSYYYINCGMEDSPLGQYSNYTGTITLRYNVYNPTSETIKAQLHVQTDYDDFWCYMYPRSYDVISIPPKTTKTVTATVPIENGNIKFSRNGNIIEINAEKVFMRFDVYFNDMEKAGNQVVIFANSSDDPILNCAWYSTNHMTPERIK